MSLLNNNVHFISTIDVIILSERCAYADVL